VQSSDIAGQLYLAGGADLESEALHDVWKFDFEMKKWTKLAVELYEDALYSRIDIALDSSINITYPILPSNSGTIRRISIDKEMNIASKVIELKELGSEDEIEYVLSETDGELDAGLATNKAYLPFNHEKDVNHDVGENVYSVAGAEGALFVGTAFGVKAFSLRTAESPLEISNNEEIAGPVRDLEVVGQHLYAATADGLAIIDISNHLDVSNFVSISGWIDSTAVRMYNGELWVSFEKGIKKFSLEDPTNPILELEIMTGAAVEDMMITDGKMFIQDKDGLKVLDLEKIVAISKDDYHCPGAILREYDGKVYTSCNDDVYRLQKNGSEYDYVSVNGEREELKDNYIFGDFVYIPDGDSVRISSSHYEILEQPVCGNGEIETDEVCDGNRKSCTSLGSEYSSGTATCNSDCLGYDKSNCVKKPVCGNGQVERGEVCDRNRKSCSSLGLGYVYGTATCNSSCTDYDKSNCQRLKIELPVCGNRRVETGEVCDRSIVSCTSLGKGYYSGSAICDLDCGGYNESSCKRFIVFPW